MPSTSDDLRALIHRWFGKDDPEGGAEQLLRSRGWTKIAIGDWRRPTASYNPSTIEAACIVYLIEEWDHAVVSGIYPHYHDYYNATEIFLQSQGTAK